MLWVVFFSFFGPAAFLPHNRSATVVLQPLRQLFEVPPSCGFRSRTRAPQSLSCLSAEHGGRGRVKRGAQKQNSRGDELPSTVKHRAVAHKLLTKLGEEFAAKRRNRKNNNLERHKLQALHGHTKKDQVVRGSWQLLHNSTNSCQLARCAQQTTPEEKHIGQYAPCVYTRVQ